jgi:hypothetical protein
MNEVSQWVPAFKIIGVSTIGVILTFLLTRYSNRIKKLSFQTVACNHNGMVPLQKKEPTRFTNSYRLQYRLKNISGSDFKEGTLILKYVKPCSILRASCKENKNSSSIRTIKKKNEVQFQITDFNRRESMIFDVELTGVSKESECSCEVSLAKCTGYKIKRIHKMPKRKFSYIRTNPYEGT